METFFYVKVADAANVQIKSNQHLFVITDVQDVAWSASYWRPNVFSVKIKFNSNQIKYNQKN